MRPRNAATRGYNRATMPNYYTRRIVEAELDELLSLAAAVVVKGPRGVGKTTTAKRRAATVFSLDDPDRRAAAEANPACVLRGEKPILIDEWHRVPQTWAAVRRAVKENPAPGQFLLTGAAPADNRTGRTAVLHMRPLCLVERGVGAPTVSLNKLLKDTRPPVAGETDVGPADYTREITASGFPATRILRSNDRWARLDDYLQRVVRDDFKDLGRKIKSLKALHRWLSAYAAASATTVSFEAIRTAATPDTAPSPSKSTTQYCRNTLKQMGILDMVPAWAPSETTARKAIRSPQHHLADPSLAARLLGLNAQALLAGAEPGTPILHDGRALDHLFRSLVALSVRVLARAAKAQVKHFCLAGGRYNVDLVIERPDRRILAVAVKFGPEINDADAKNLHWLKKKFEGKLLDLVVLNAGPRAYRREDGVAVVPVALLGP